MAAVLIPSAEFRHAHEQQARLCDAADEVERIREFDAEFVHNFIVDFAKCEGDAEMWLQDQGVHKTCIASAELLRMMCQSWQANPMAVYAVAGTKFWEEMKKLAYEVWSSN
ncbi:MAG TPA: hypothetical protein VJ654_14245 [Noviherbaspirillum sp.]|nr:hypothetical protein [Noviherbaspirillum sp.]